MSYILGHSAARPGWHVITVGGKCDENVAPGLGAAVENAFERGATTLVMDLGEVTFIDSTAIDVLLAAQRRLKASGGTFEVVCSAPAVVAKLMIAGLEPVSRRP